MDFITKIQKAVATRNDLELSKLFFIKWSSFSPEHVEVSKSAKTLRAPTSMGGVWGTILNHYIVCLGELDLSSSDDSERNYLGACDAANVALKILLENRPEDFRLTVRALINNAQNIAHKAKENPKSDDKDDTLLKKIFDTIDPKVNALLRDLGKVSTALDQLTLTLCNAWITIASSLKKKMIVQSTLDVVEPIIERNRSNFPISDVVSFNYFKGKSDITNEKEKFECFNFAFDHCLKGSHNKRVILRSLVAMAIVSKRDVYPSPAILDKYELTDAYSGIIRSIKLGNPVLFDQELDRNVAIFSKWGHYFTIVKARFKLWRNVCRFAQNYLKWKEVKRPDALHFYLLKDIVAVTTKGQYVPCDDELECIFANAIAERYLNASIFINDTIKVLLLDPNDPFFLNKVG